MRRSTPRIAIIALLLIPLSALPDGNQGIPGPEMFQKFRGMSQATTEEASQWKAALRRCEREERRSYLEITREDGHRVAYRFTKELVREAQLHFAKKHAARIDGLRKATRQDAPLYAGSSRSSYAAAIQAQWDIEQRRLLERLKRFGEIVGHETLGQMTMERIRDSYAKHLKQGDLEPGPDEAKQKPRGKHEPKPGEQDD